MADRTAIEWTRGADGSAGATWTPIRARWLEADGGNGKPRVGWHCEKVSDGCKNCYAAGINRRLGTGFDFKPGHRSNVEVFLDETLLLAPLRWRRPRRIFVCSMTDLFADFVPDALIDRVFAVMALARQHTFQCLTKRPARMRAYITAPDVEDRVNAAMDDIAPAHWCTREVEDFGGWPLRNAWLGVSTEDQATADTRVPELLATPAALRFISAEPLLGPVFFRNLPIGAHHAALGLKPFDTRFDALHPGLPCRIDWIVAGGESGTAARPMHPHWPLDIRDQCACAGVPYFFKQWGSWVPHRPEAGGDLGGDVRAGRVTVVHPTGESEVEIFRRTGGRNTIPGTRYVRRLTKKAAGRLLVGEEWSQMPEARA